MIGAYMVRAGEDVEFVDTASDHVAKMKQDGLTIEAFDATFTVPVKALSPSELQGPLDVMLLAVKGQHTEAAMKEIIPHLTEDSCVVSVQNGLCEKTISAMIGPERTIGCFINPSSDYMAPGLIKHAAPGAFYLAELDGRITPRLEAIAKAIGHWGEVRLTTNIWDYLWAKLGYANMLFATTLVDADIADIVDQHRELMVELACEVYEVAEGEGAHPKPFNAIEPSLYYPRENQDWEAINESLDRLVALRRTDAKTRSGIWRDIAVRHRKTEVDEQSGKVVGIGRSHGIECPLTSRVVTMIHELEDGKRSMGWENIKELEGLRTGE